MRIFRLKRHTYDTHKQEFHKKFFDLFFVNVAFELLWLTKFLA